MSSWMVSFREGLFVGLFIAGLGFGVGYCNGPSHAHADPGYPSDQLRGIQSELAGIRRALEKQERCR